MKTHSTKKNASVVGATEASIDKRNLTRKRKESV